jgi:DNA-binding protein Fis
VPPAPNADPPIIFARTLPTIKQASQLLVTEAMRRCDGNQSKASKMLGISQQALSKRLKNQRACR